MRDMKVMMVCGEPDVRSSIRAALELQGGSGLAAMVESKRGVDNRETVNRISRESPDLVLLDIEYPALTGVELGRSVNHTCRGTRVVALSTNPEEDSDEVLDVMRMGAVAYVRINKTAPGALAETLRKAWGGEYPVDEVVIANHRIAERVLRCFEEMKVADGAGKPLSDRDTEMLRSMAEGNSMGHTAARMEMSELTLRNELGRILRRLSVESSDHDAPTGIRNDLIAMQVARDGNLLIFGGPLSHSRPRSRASTSHRS